MIEIFNGILFNVGSASDIRLKVWYEHKRNGNAMSYRFKWRMYLAYKNSEAHNPYAYYQNNRKFELYLNESLVYTNNTQSSANGWDTGEIVTNWYDVTNKTSGTTPFRFYAVDTANTGWMNYQSGTMQLDIDPAGTIISELNDFIIGENINLISEIYDENYVNTLTIKIGDNVIGTRDVSDENVTIAFTEKELDNIYDLTKNEPSPYNFVFEILTMDGETQIGDISEKTIKGTLNDAEPDINAITLSVNSPVATAGKIVKGVSDVSVTVATTMKKKATLKSVRINGQEATLVGNIATLSFTKVTNGTFDVIIEDSRGNTNSGSESKDVIDYIALTLSAILDRPSQTSGELLLSFSGHYWNGNFGGENNTLSCNWKYREKGSETWKNGTSITSITYSDNKYESTNQSLNTLLGVEDDFFSYQKNYEILVTAQDKINTTQILYVVTKGIPIVAWYEDGTEVINGNLDVIGEIYKNGEPFSGGDTLPIGTQIPVGTADTTKLPTNWLVCDGRAVSRTAYKDLFNVIGTSYGPGDGSTTFNLPDKRGRNSVGYDSTQEEFNAIGKKGGEKIHQLTVEELPSHAHGQNVTANSNSGGSGIRQDWDIDANGLSIYSQGIDTSATGGDKPHNNLPPYEVDNWIIKAMNGYVVVDDTIAKVTNEYSDSITNVYSCDYVNNIIDKIDFKEIYIKSEVIVGYYHNGKPIYRAIIEDVLTGGDYIKDVDEVIDKSIWIYSIYGHWWEMGSSGGGAGAGYETSMFVANNALNLLTGGFYTVNQSPIRGWIEYTKVSDKANV